MTSELAAFLADLRQHPLFPQLMKAVPAPSLKRFRISQAQESEKARAEWVYLSGRCDQHDQWLALLAGRVDNQEQQ